MLRLLTTAAVLAIVRGNTFTLIDDNDDAWQLPVQVTDKEMTSAEFCKHVFEAKEYQAQAKQKNMATEGGVGCDIFNLLGTKVTSYQGISSNSSVYAVKHGMHFVWPATPIGTRHVIAGLSDTPQEIILESLYEYPKIFRIHNFLTDEETTQLINNAKKMKLTPSTAGLHQKGASGDNQGELISGRTSHNAWDQNSPLSKKLKLRSYELLRIKYVESSSDGFQVVHYDPSQLYLPHHDYFGLESTTKDWNFDPRNGGSNRFATVFLYLSDVEAGGETVFPQIPGDFPPTDGLTEEYVKKRKNELFPGIKEKQQFVDTCRTKFRVKPKRGDAILFYHQNHRGDLDVGTLHGACPVLEGEKWGANLWIWNKQTYMPYYIKVTNRMKLPVDMYQINALNKPDFEITLQPGQAYQASSFLFRKFLAKVGEEVVHKLQVKESVYAYAVTGKKKAKAKAVKNKSEL